MFDLSRIDFKNVTKLLIVIVIVIVATIHNPLKLAFLDRQVTKVILLLILLLVLYYDTHLGLLLITLFLILLVQMNHGVMEEAHNKVEAFRLSAINNSQPEHSNDATCNYGETLKEEASQNHVDYILDDKVKPYEVFVKMMTNQEHLDMASNSAILDGL